VKIALIGNMNNNNFALMRYFRDLGADAHLLLYKGDGANTLSHFCPENDTWEIERWAPFIHQTKIENGPFSILGNPERLIFPYQPLCYLKYAIKFLMRRQGRRILPPTVSELRAAFSGYDRYVGSGLSPAILNRMGLALDIFYPYATGIEFLASPEFLSLKMNSRYLIRKTLERVEAAQRTGIDRARFCLNAEMSVTRNAFQANQIKFITLAIPMVYSQELPPNERRLSAELIAAKKEIEDSDLAILMHSRLMWCKQATFTNSEWASWSKNSDWLVREFARLLVMRPGLKARLFILEYGPDIEATKALSTELGIEHAMTWLPKMARRELMSLIAACDIGVGEFYRDHGVLWGGTGWEVLSQGKPLLQSYNFDDGEYEAIFGYPPPPMLPVKSRDCILRHLIDMADHAEKRKAIGRGAAEWFGRYNGIGLAAQWLNILTRPN